MDEKREHIDLKINPKNVVGYFLIGYDNV